MIYILKITVEEDMRKTKIITTSWDDGCKEDLKLSKLLCKYGLKGTFYISPFMCARKKNLTNDEIKKLDELHEVGAHTLSHIDLTSVSLNEAKKEIEGSKVYLEQLLKHSVDMFCYPWGHYNEKIKIFIRSIGFLGARTIDEGSVNFPSDHFEWRTSVYASNSSPSITLRTWLKLKMPIVFLLDWEVRAKLIFDYFLKRGEIYHLWGHSWEIEKRNYWDKIENVFAYISRRNDVQYETNGEIIRKVIDNRKRM